MGLRRSSMERLRSRDGGATHLRAGTFERDARLIHRCACGEHIVDQNKAPAWKRLACGKAPLHILLAFRPVQYALIARGGRVERSYAWEPALARKASGQKFHVIEASSSSSGLGCAHVGHAIRPPQP